MAIVNSPLKRIVQNESLGPKSFMHNLRISPHNT